MEDSSNWVGPEVSGKGGVYKSLSDDVNKQDALFSGGVLAFVTIFSLQGDDCAVQIEYYHELG
jgi:hypothetical protein